MTERCGSFPFLAIAEDYGLPYGTVLRYAEGMDTGRRIPPADLAIVWDALGAAWRIAGFECQVLKALGWKNWPSSEDSEDKR